MEGKKTNSQVFDLRSEPCPMNLVKFKFYLHENKSFSVMIAKTGEGFKNITNFLNYKGIIFKIIEENDFYIISIE